MSARELSWDGLCTVFLRAQPRGASSAPSVRWYPEVPDVELTGPRLPTPGVVPVAARVASEAGEHADAYMAVLLTSISPLFFQWFRRK